MKEEKKIEVCEHCNTPVQNEIGLTKDENKVLVMTYECNCGRTKRKDIAVDKNGMAYMED